MAIGAGFGEIRDRPFRSGLVFAASTIVGGICVALLLYVVTPRDVENSLSFKRHMMHCIRDVSEERCKEIWRWAARYND